MIRLDVKDYCKDCCDFEADVTKPEKLQIASGSEWKVMLSDTVVSCEHAKRCETIKRYLEKQITKGNNE